MFMKENHNKISEVDTDIWYSKQRNKVLVVCGIVVRKMRSSLQ